MTENSTVQLTFGIDDPQLDEEDKQDIAQKLLRQLRNLDEIEGVERTQNLESEDGTRSVFSTLIGCLTVEVNRKNIGKLLKWLGDRLSDKPIEIRVKVGDKEVSIKASSKEELAAAEERVDRWLEKLTD